MSTSDVLRYIAKQHRQGRVSRDGFELCVRQTQAIAVRSRIERTAKRVLGRRSA